MFSKVPVETRKKFFSDKCEELSKDEFKLIREHIIRHLNENVMYWNKDTRRLAESVVNSTEIKELKSLVEDLRKKGVDPF